MKIYLDYIFLENLVVNTVIIVETVIFTNLKISKNRRNICIFISTILSILEYLIPQINNIFFHIFFSCFMLLILFNFKNIFDYLKKIASYYLIYIVYIGIIISSTIIFNINLNNFLNKILLYIYSGIVLHILIQNLWKMWKTKIKSSDLEYNLVVDDVEINSFIDTGNNVKDPITSLNVIFLDKKLMQKIKTDKLNITYFKVNTINGTDIKEGYIVTNVKVKKDEKEIAIIPKIILCFSMNYNTSEKYSAIIGYDTYLENIDGGVEY